MTLWILTSVFGDIYPGTTEGLYEYSPLCLCHSLAYFPLLWKIFTWVICYWRKDIYSPLGGERGEEKIENLVLSKTTLCHVQLPRRITNSELTCLLLQALVRYWHGCHFAISYALTSVIVQWILSCALIIMYIDLCLFSCEIEHLVAD